MITKKSGINFYFFNKKNKDRVAGFMIQLKHYFYNENLKRKSETMIKLIKHLKPFIFPLILAFGLLFVQAQADLALPDYMSNIVNVGIQQSGFEEGVPELLSVEEYNKIEIFLSTENSLVFENDYILIRESDSRYFTYKETYPNIEEEIYVLVNDKSEIEYLTKPLIMITGIKKMMLTNEEIDFNGNILPANTDLFFIMRQMPKENIKEIVSSTIESFGDLKETILRQGTIEYTKELYESLGADISKVQRDYILSIGQLMILITLVGAVASIVVGFIAAKIAAGVGRNLREKIFNKISSFSNKEFDSFSTASLITRSTNDVNQIQNLLIIMIRMLIYAPLLGIGGVFKALEKNADMAWIIALGIILIIITIGTIFIIALPKFKIVQKLVDRLNLVMRENLSGLLVIRAFNTEKFEEKRFEKANHDLAKTNLFVGRLMSILFPIMMFVMNGVVLLVIWVGAKEIAASNMQVGDMMAFMQYAMQIIMSFLMLSMMFILIPRASVSAVRINEVLETKTTIADPKDPKKIKNLKGEIVFKNVSFKYDGAEENMLKNINFIAKPGKTTAIIGSTGSGKTTILNLIPRFYDVTSGSIKIDGTNIKDITQKELHDLIGYVPQKSVLFSGTIAENVKFSDDNLDDKVMKEALSIAQGLEIVAEKEKGYDAPISQGGTNVSGGQKQRLSIARTIAKDPLIYLFDDSFSALDFKTDRELRKALLEKTKHKTILIIAQRISTIRDADQIIVVDDGGIISVGKHDDLIKNCEVYKEIAYSQLSKEELA